MREKQEVRVFFALWPDDETRHWINRTADRLALEKAARRVPAYNLHLTLHFIGNVALEELECLRRQARRVRTDRFSLTLDCFGLFRKPRVAWLGCSVIPAGLARLHAMLGDELSHCEFEPETRPYRPHVTLLRKTTRDPASAEAEPRAWAVVNFVLIESRSVGNGVKYEVLETYPLR